MDICHRHWSSERRTRSTTITYNVGRILYPIIGVIKSKTDLNHYAIIMISLKIILITYIFNFTFRICTHVYIINIICFKI